MKNRITQRILAFWLSGAPTPRVNSVNAKIPKVTPSKNKAIEAYHKAPKIGPKITHANPLSESNHEVGTVNVPILSSINLGM